MLKNLHNSLHRFGRDVSGATAVMVALLLPSVIGGMGLGAEAGYWYLVHRNLQHAADVSAHAAGVRRRSGDSADELEVTALDVAAKAGFDENNGSLELSWPPTSGSYAGATDAVEVVLIRTVPRLLTAMFAEGPVTMRARAVALVNLGSDACVLALAPTASAAFTVSSSASVSLDCDAASDSVAADSFSVDGTGRLSARCASTVGGASVNTSVTLSECDAVQEYHSYVPDPYRDVAEPVPPTSCDSNNKNLGNPNTTTTVSPGSTTVSGMPAYHFCGGLSLKGNVTFEPGLYIVSGGDFTANAGAQAFGSGVTFYVTSPNRIKLAGNADLNLSAPTSGELSGILFFGSRDASGVEHKVNGASGSVLEGAIYAPTTALDFTGNSNSGGSGGCTQVIGYTVTFSGNSGLASSCETSGTRDMKVNEVVKLVE